MNAPGVHNSRLKANPLGYWEIYYSIGGRSRRVSCRTKNFPEAKRQLKEWRAQHETTRNLTMSDTTDLTLVLQKLDQVIQDNQIFRDDMRVQTAIIMRIDTTMGTVLTELRAMHARHDRLAKRVERLEKPEDAL